MIKHFEVSFFDFACRYVVHELNHCGEPVVTCSASSGGHDVGQACQLQEPSLSESFLMNF